MFTARQLPTAARMGVSTVRKWGKPCNSRRAPLSQIRSGSKASKRLPPVRADSMAGSAELNQESEYVANALERSREKRDSLRRRLAILVSFVTFVFWLSAVCAEMFLRKPF
jgi:hypothetical protein